MVRYRYWTLPMVRPLGYHQFSDYRYKQHLNYTLLGLLLRIIGMNFNEVSLPWFWTGFEFGFGNQQ